MHVWCIHNGKEFGELLMLVNSRGKAEETCTSSNGTKTKGIMPLRCETAGTSGLCDSSSCHPSTTPRMSSSGSLISLSFTPLVTSESRSIRLLAPTVVPLNLYKKADNQNKKIKLKNLQVKVPFNKVGRTLHSTDWRKKI